MHTTRQAADASAAPPVQAAQLAWARMAATASRSAAISPPPPPPPPPRPPPPPPLLRPRLHRARGAAPHTSQPTPHVSQPAMTRWRAPACEQRPCQLARLGGAPRATRMSAPPPSAVPCRCVVAAALCHSPPAGPLPRDPLGTRVGSLTGSLTGSPTGSLTGSLTGSPTGSPTGSLTGSPTGSPGTRSPECPGAHGGRTPPPQPSGQRPVRCWPRAVSACTQRAPR